MDSTFIKVIVQALQLDESNFMLTRLGNFDATQPNHRKPRLSLNNFHRLKKTKWLDWNYETDSRFADLLFFYDQT